MSLWAVANSSLMLGTDLTGMDPGDLAMLKNDEVIGVNQAGRAAHPVDRLTRSRPGSHRTRTAPTRSPCSTST